MRSKKDGGREKKTQKELIYYAKIFSPSVISLKNLCEMPPSSSEEGFCSCQLYKNRLYHIIIIFLNLIIPFKIIQFNVFRSNGKNSTLFQKTATLFRIFTQAKNMMILFRKSEIKGGANCLRNGLQNSLTLMFKILLQNGTGDK